MSLFIRNCQPNDRIPSYHYYTLDRHRRDCLSESDRFTDSTDVNLGPKYNIQVLQPQ